MSHKIRVKHNSLKTENIYIYWAKKYILFHNKRHPNTMGRKEVEEYLTYLARNQNVTPNTQNQTFYSIVFLYEQVLNISLKEQNIQALRAKERKHIPVVLTINELLGHKFIETTMIYTHVLKELNKNEIKSPLDF